MRLDRAKKSAYYRHEDTAREYLGVDVVYEDGFAKIVTKKAKERQESEYEVSHSGSKWAALDFHGYIALVLESLDGCRPRAYIQQAYHDQLVDAGLSLFVPDDEYRICAARDESGRMVALWSPMNELGLNAELGEIKSEIEEAS